MDGILVVDKPRGMTSMDLVRRLKRASGQKHVGHGGTLDPIATGVVPVFFGHATKVMEYVVDGHKEYRAIVELGVATDTYDSEGTVTSRRDASGVSEGDVAAALSSFQGELEQVPPMYSALKHGGKRLYDLARAGVEVDRNPRRVEVYTITLEAFTPPLATIHVTCSRGFYMRSLAHDLGGRLGCGGHLVALARLRSGPFALEEALQLAEAEAALAEGTCGPLLYAPDVPLRHLRAAVLGPRLERFVEYGRALPPRLGGTPIRPDERCRAYSIDGRFLAILAYNAALRRWQPYRLFATRQRAATPPP